VRGQPAWDGWFNWGIRRNRLSFFLGFLLLVLVLLLAGSAFYFFSSSNRSLTLFKVAFLLPASICSYFLTAQRLRDMNVTGWLALLWIPAGLADQFLHGAASLSFWLVLLAVPGSSGPNRYGPDPLTADPAEVFR
jgi:uncharacterized membrane protein YhaH (DUF805 family)